MVSYSVSSWSSQNVLRIMQSLQAITCTFQPTKIPNVPQTPTCHHQDMHHMLLQLRPANATNSKIGTKHKGGMG